jgi:hypothetical protein
LKKDQISHDEYQRVALLTENQEEHSDSLHYRYMKREFHSNKFIWIVQGVFYIGVLIMYLMVSGNEIIYDLWVPLDLLIFCSMGIYALSEYRSHEQKKLKEAQLAAIVEKRLASGISNLMKNSSGESDQNER